MVSSGVFVPESRDISVRLFYMDRWMSACREFMILFPALSYRFVGSKCFKACQNRFPSEMECGNMLIVMEFMGLRSLYERGLF